MRLPPDTETSPEAVLEGLDRDQRAAVTADPGVVVVRAGAGSGKTTVLTRRIAWRVASGSASPDRVLAITFTRQAASEMRTRLRRMGIDGNPSVHTFHALGLRVLSGIADDNGRPRPNVATGRAALLASAAGDGFRRGDLGALATAVDWAAVRMVEPRDADAALRVAGLSRVLGTDEFAAIVERYGNLKRRRGVVDTNDLIAGVLREAARDTRIAVSVRQMFRHVSVDEAQDMNPLQYAFLRLLVGDAPDLFLVGDPHQAIYGFNGADNTLFDELPGLPGATVVSLPSNYRCSPEVVDAATRLMRNGGQTVESRSVRPHGREVRWVGCTDENDETAQVVRLVGDMRARCGTWNLLAVLTRTNALADEMSTALREAGVPVRSSRRGPEWAAALAHAVTLQGREAMSVWSSDILDGTEDEDGSANRELAGLMRAYLDEHRGRGVDGRGFGSWLVTSVDRTDVEGVEVMTFHSAKGRQWWGVVVAGAEDGWLPHSSARTKAEKAEEARLGYVAFTRAADELAVTWATARRGRTRRRSPLLPVSATVVTSGSGPGDTVRRLKDAAPVADPLVEALREWRATLARRTRLDATGLLTDHQVLCLAAERPGTIDGVAEITDRSFAARHGESLLAVLARHP
ncbi:MAG: UvrD-helicase domain-containing protein [Ilumatobacteraceae bacterium]